MPSFRSLSLVLATLVLLLTCAAAAAQDVVTVGTVTADGAAVQVPVSIRDASGTSLGVDQPAASRIQAFSISITYAPASAVSAVTFSRAGITGSLHPVFETTPSSSGEVTLLASFQQSSNPIPFTLNGAGAGDVVASLSFTLSSSAAPGTLISLTLDAATTQLTDEGGSAATKETTSNGRLALVNGSITIPVPSLTLSPGSQPVEAGSSGQLAIDTGTRLLANTSVTLSSSDPATVSVPPSVTVIAGTRFAFFLVSALSPGTATITASLPPSAGGDTATAEVTVTEVPNCPVPSAPAVSGPATALAGSTYTITWTATADATEYIIDESTDPLFGPASPRTLSGTTTTYSHASAGVRYYYRVRARNHAQPCDAVSANSPAISVLITAVPVSLTRILPVVGSGAGNAGSFFRTSLQLYNPGSASISGKLLFHPQGASGSATDPSLAYSIPARRTLSFSDLLPAMGIAGGLGSIDLIGDAGSGLPVTVARVFNDGGAAGTTGIALDTMAAADALKQGEVGALLAPTDLQKFRFNIGFRTLDQGAAMTVTVRDRDGVIVRTLTKSFGPTFFNQTSAGDFLEGYQLTGGETVSLELTSGSAFVYGATTDNVTNDPSAQFARRVD